MVFGLFNNTAGGSRSVHSQTCGGGCCAPINWWVNYIAARASTV